MIIELIVEDYGVLVTKHSERVQVKKDGKLVQEVPLIHLEGIILASSGLTISADLIELCARPGIPLSFITRRKVDEEGRFDQPSRKLIAQKVFTRIDSAEVYGGKKHKLREIIQMQARRVATAVRGSSEYKRFIFRW